MLLKETSCLCVDMKWSTFRGLNYNVKYNVKKPNKLINKINYKIENILKPDYFQIQQLNPDILLQTGSISVLLITFKDSSFHTSKLTDEKAADNPKLDTR